MILISLILVILGLSFNVILGHHPHYKKDSYRDTLNKVEQNEKDVHNDKEHCREKDDIHIEVKLGDINAVQNVNVDSSTGISSIGCTPNDQQCNSNSECCTLICKYSNDFSYRYCSSF